jgi:HlyD family secretion protein
VDPRHRPTNRAAGLRAGRSRGFVRPLVLAALGLLAIGGIVASVVLAWRPGEGESTRPLVYEVRSQEFAFDVVERGEVESSSNVEIRCEVKARNSSGTAILEVIPEGTIVEPGQVLVRLDASALEQERVQQQIACNTAEAALIQSRNMWEAAEIARTEYLEGTFRQEEQTILGEIFVAEENLRRAQQYARYSELLAAKGYITALQLEGDRFAVDKARNDLETARTRLRVLQEYTKEKMLKQFDADIKTAEAKMRGQESSYQLELTKLADIVDQIAKCVVRAPQGGQVKYANIASSSSRSSSNDFIVEPGAMVRERQAIIFLPDAARMQVKSKINESRIALVSVGMPVSIKIDAFGGKPLAGEVIKVNEYPEPSSWYSSSIKEYATIIRVIEPPQGIRAGLTAEVTVHVEYQPAAIQVPVQAIVEHGGRHWCVVTDGKTWDYQPITVGSSNDKFAVVREGLSAGQQVALNPRSYVERRPPTEVRPGPSEQLVQASRAERHQGSAGVAASSEKNSAAPVAAVPGGLSERRGPGKGGADPNAFVESFFSRSDANGDNFLTPDEIPADAPPIFAGADSNGDGKIDRAELLAALARRSQQGAGRADAAGGTPGAGE